jgi:nodulation protein E
MSIPKVMTNASASRVSMHPGITGPCYTVSTACASAAHAIGQAFWMVRSGLVDAAVAGGTEAPVTLGMLRAWEAMRVVAPDTCRPFSRDRRG